MVSEHIGNPNISMAAISSLILLLSRLITIVANAETHNATQSSLLNVNMVNIAKLNSTNFMTWSLQIHTLLDSYDLVGFINGSLSVPE